MSIKSNTPNLFKQQYKLNGLLKSVNKFLELFRCVFMIFVRQNLNYEK